MLLKKMMSCQAQFVSFMPVCLLSYCMLGCPSSRWSDPWLSVQPKPFTGIIALVRCRSVPRPTSLYCALIRSIWLWKTARLSCVTLKQVQVHAIANCQTSTLPYNAVNGIMIQQNDEGQGKGMRREPLGETGKFVNTPAGNQTQNA